MTGKVKIHYTLDWDGRHHIQKYHAHIEVQDGLIYSLHAEARTKEEARDKVIAKYKEIPEPEEVEVK